MVAAAAVTVPMASLAMVAGCWPLVMVVVMAASVGEVMVIVVEVMEYSFFLYCTSSLYKPDPEL